MPKKKRKPKPTPSIEFKEAINTATHLKLKDGLTAIKRGEGKGRITAENPRNVLGSVNIDDDWLKAAPNSNRWDYVIGYDRSGKVVAYFVEVHSAETSEVSKIEKKLNWLLGDVLRDETNAELASLTREIHWIASGRIKIPQHSRQYKYLATLRKRGLLGPSKQLTMK